MSNFTSVLDRLDRKIMAIFCDSAVLRPKAGGADVPVDVQLRFPAQADQLNGVSIVRARPIVKAAVLQVPSLVKGDVIIFNGNGYRVAEAPARPGTGRWWHAEVEPLGATA